MAGYLSSIVLQILICVAVGINSPMLWSMFADVAGYDAALASQAGGTLTAIKALMSIVPAVGSLLGLVCLIFYPLSTARMKTIQCELEIKRNK